MNRRLWPFELSAVMTFGVIGLLTLSSGISWKERLRIITENQQLREEVARSRLATSISAVADVDSHVLAR